jgi:hypothetical protein
MNSPLVISLFESLRKLAGARFSKGRFVDIVGGDKRARSIPNLPCLNLSCKLSLNLRQDNTMIHSSTALIGETKLSRRIKAAAHFALPPILYDTHIHAISNMRNTDTVP